MKSNGRAFAVFRDNSREWLVFLALLLGAAFYVGKAWTPSSYAIVLNMLGEGQVQPVLGTPQGVRSDEFFVQTPYFQMAVRSGLADQETVSPYRQSLKNFMAFPTKNWSVVFKPALWGFLFLPPANAYSFYFCLLSLSALLGWFAFLRSMRIPAGIAAAGATALLFSHFFQVWWTTNAPAFAFAPWVGFAFLAPRKEWLRCLAVFYAVAAWVFGLLYPPFIYALGLAMGLAILALRPDAIRVRSLVSSFVAAIAAGLVIYFYMHDIIGVMRQTVYPGQRSLAGGTTPWVQVLATIAPYLNTINFDPSLLTPQARNECEVGALSSYLLVLILCFAAPNTIKDFYATHKRPVATVAAGLTVMCAWMILPIPAAVGHLVLLDKVPPNRLVVGFGLLLHISLFYLASKLRFAVTAQRVVIFVIATLGLMVVRKWHLPSGILRQSWFDVVAPTVMLTAYLFMRWQPQRSLAPATMLTGVAALTNVLTFGTFNPLQSANPFFRDYASGTIGQLHELQASSGLVILPGWYGAALNGLGIRAINDTLISPQRAFFAEHFPQIEPERTNAVFNRYGHVIPDFIDAPYSSGDQIHVPIQSFLTGKDIELADTKAITDVAGNVFSYSLLRKDDGGFDIQITGWADFGTPNPAQRLLYNAPAWKPLGVVREPRLDVANAYADPKLALAGFRAFWSTDAGVFPADLQLASFDPTRGSKVLPGLLGLSLLDRAPAVLPLAEGKGFVDSVSFDNTSHILHMQGWLPFEPRTDQELRIYLLAGKVIKASLTRSERPDVAERIGADWRYAGFDLKVTVNNDPAFDPSKFCLLAFDPNLGTMQLHLKNATSCPRLL